MKRIYLDYAAATPMSPEVSEAMKPYPADKFYNPSAVYLAARHVRQDLEKARQTVAVLLGARPAEIIFTAGATEANNLAVQGVMRKFPKAEILVSAIEHESILEPARLFGGKEIPVDENGIIILNKLSNLINDKTVLVSVMLVNNELGTVQPLSEVARILDAKLSERRSKGSRLPLYLHTDAAQAGNYLGLQTARLGVDLMSINGGKIYGPKQAGVLYIKAGTEIQPLIVGGGQEHGLRSGTENLAGAVGFTKALETAQGERHRETKRTADLRHSFEDELLKLIPAIVINGSRKNRAPHLLSVTFPGADNERLMMELDEAGIMCAAGSACSASQDEPSHVLTAIGLSEADARSTLRFSVGRQTSPGDIARTVKVLAKLIGSNR